MPHAQVLRNQTVGSTCRVCPRAAGIAGSELDHEILRRLLCVVAGDVPETGVEHAGVGKLVLGLELAAALVLGEEIVVGKSQLGIQIAPAHPRVRRCRIDVPPVFLGVLAVVSLRTGQSEDPLLEDGIDAVPERECEAEQLVLVTDRAEPLLAPAERARPRLVVRDIVPRVTVGAVVLAHGPPGTLADVRTPAPPAGRIITESRALGVVAHGWSTTWGIRR